MGNDKCAHELSSAIVAGRGTVVYCKLCHAEVRGTKEEFPGLSFDEIMNLWYGTLEDSQHEIEAKSTRIH